MKTKISNSAMPIALAIMIVSILVVIATSASLKNSQDTRSSAASRSVGTLSQINENAQQGLANAEMNIQRLETVKTEGGSVQEIIAIARNMVKQQETIEAQLASANQVGLPTTDLYLVLEEKLGRQRIALEEAMESAPATTMTYLRQALQKTIEGQARVEEVLVQ